jgi:hypothetical protein
MQACERYTNNCTWGLDFYAVKNLCFTCSLFDKLWLSKTVYHTVFILAISEFISFILSFLQYIKQITAFTKEWYTLLNRPFFKLTKVYTILTSKSAPRPHEECFSCFPILTESVTSDKNAFKCCIYRHSLNFLAAKKYRFSLKSAPLTETVYHEIASFLRLLAETVPITILRTLYYPNLFTILPKTLYPQQTKKSRKTATECHIFTLFFIFF